VTFDLESRSKDTGSSRNVPRFPTVEVWRGRTHSEWLPFKLKKNIKRKIKSFSLSFSFRNQLKPVV